MSVPDSMQHNANLAGADAQGASTDGRALRVYDTHIHADRLDGPPPACGAYRALVPGIDPVATQAAVARAHPSWRIAVALHPWAVGDAAPELEERWQLVDTLSRSSHLTAIGETGLDRRRHTSDEAWASGVAWFERHCALAVERAKPLVVHCVRAHGPCLEALARTGAGRVGGIVHAFSGAPEVAEAYARLGFCVGIGPAVTRAAARRVRDAAARVPLEHLVVETDAPFMAVSTLPGTAADILPVLAALAALRRLPIDTVADATWSNAERVLGR